MLYGSVSGGALQIGDRVIVASSMAGTKTGTLRYLGPADFAKGEWAGIELDAPLGKKFLYFISVADPDPRSGAFLTPGSGIRDE